MKENQPVKAEPSDLGETERNGTERVQIKSYVNIDELSEHRVKVSISGKSTENLLLEKNEEDSHMHEEYSREYLVEE